MQHSSMESGGFALLKKNIAHNVHVMQSFKVKGAPSSGTSFGTMMQIRLRKVACRCTCARRLVDVSGAVMAFREVQKGMGLLKRRLRS